MYRHIVEVDTSIQLIDVRDDAAILRLGITSTQHTPLWRSIAPNTEGATLEFPIKEITLIDLNDDRRTTGVHWPKHNVHNLVFLSNALRASHSICVFLSSYNITRSSNGPSCSKDICCCASVVFGGTMWNTFLGRPAIAVMTVPKKKKKIASNDTKKTTNTLTSKIIIKSRDVCN